MVLFIARQECLYHMTKRSDVILLRTFTVVGKASPGERRAVPPTEENLHAAQASHHPECRKA